MNDIKVLLSKTFADDERVENVWRNISCKNALFSKGFTLKIGKKHSEEILFKKSCVQNFSTIHNRKKIYEVTLIVESHGPKAVHTEYIK